MNVRDGIAQPPQVFFCNNSQATLPKDPLCIVHPVWALMVLLRCKVHEEKVVSVVYWVFVHYIPLVVCFQDFLFWKDTYTKSSVVS